MEIRFSTKGNPKQLECAKAWIDDITLEIIYGGSKASGKSFLGCSLIFGDALLYPGTHYFIARKKLNDLRKFTIPSIHEVFNIWGITSDYYRYNGQDNIFELANGSKVFLLDAKYLPGDPIFARFGSMQITRGWIEEAGEFEEEAKTALQASIGRWKNKEYNLSPKLLQTCNPAKNYLYAKGYKPFKEGKLPPHICFIQALPSDNKMLPVGYIANLELILSGNEQERLLKGNWEYDDDPLVMMDYNKILDMFTNEFVIPDVSKRYMICDLAYEGADIFTISVWHGLCLVEWVAIDKISELLVSKTIHELRIKHNVPISQVAYDANGLRTFVKEAGKTGHLQGARQILNNAKAVNGERFKSLKAQMYFKLADYVAKDKIRIVDQKFRQKIIEELEQIRKTMRSNDTDPHDIEKKEDIKKRLGRSPDFADNLAYRMWFELKHHTSTAASWAGAFA